MNAELPFDTPDDDPDDDAARVEGTLTHITFRNEDNGWTVAKMDAEGHDDPVTLVGSLPGIEPGDSLRIIGRWTEHPSFGKQLATTRCEVRLPTGRKGLVNYLGGGRLKGIGPKTAEKIVDVLGLDVLERLRRNPGLLSSVPGIGHARAAEVARQLAEQEEESAALVFLQDQGLGPGQAARVYRAYGVQTIELVRKNPYRMAEDVFGVGFRIADGVARSLGFEIDSGFRITSGLSHLLARAAQDGHVGMPMEELVRGAAPFLEVDEVRVEQVLVEALEGGQLVEDGLVYRPDLHAAEASTARHLRRLAGGERATDLAASAGVRWAEERAGIELSDDQRQALSTALQYPVSVVTGGPGVGKTTLVRCLVDVFRSQGCAVVLAAPTGRAARRLEQAAGQPASTLHRLLQLRPGGVGRPHDAEPVEADVVIVDETSMVDIVLMAALVEALRDHTTLVLVGDVDQLPSVGAGEVLRALINSDVLPVARLATIFRQAEHSGIVRVAHELNAGRLPEFDPGPKGQAFWVERPDPHACVAALIEMLTARIPSVFKLNPIRDVQVLTPMHRGPLGTIALNEALREALNPPDPRREELTRFGRLFREGDKVMQVRNDYDLEVFNGDIGLLRRLDEDAGIAEVDFEGRVVEYGLDQLTDLEPAFAITCHKSQGSEFPAVILPLVRGQHLMLRRNLVYTAFTRAKQLLVALGERDALQTAVHTADTGRRNGRLAERLRGE